MKPKYNLFSAYPQCNYIHPPTLLEWVHDGSGSIDVFTDDYVKIHEHFGYAKHRIAILVEPRTIQPAIYEWVEQNYTDFDYIFTHDDKILSLPNAKRIYFMNWYESYDVAKTKNISMICSDKVMCDEHKKRQELADALGNRVDHYGMYKGGRYCSYYECRAEYRFEVVIDNNWSGYWASEKLANPLACKTIPIYLGGKYIPGDIDPKGVIIAESLDDIIGIVDRVMDDPIGLYLKKLSAVIRNFRAVQRYKIFEDWFYTEYEDLLRKLE